MQSPAPDSIEDFVDAVEPREATLLVCNRTEPAPILSLLETAFQRQPVHVVEREVPGPIEDAVVLLDASGVVASSSLQDLARSFLLINADRYRTGPNDLDEHAVPDVLRELSDVVFELRGYPASVKEKLLLISLSRFVEARALRVDAGELRVGFQRLSRLEDEFGTGDVYARLGDSSVETHVYGVGDAADLPAGLHVHADSTEEYRRSWFLVFEPPTPADAVALVAWETGENVWRGAWTFDATVASEVGAFLRDRL